MSDIQRLPLVMALSLVVCMMLSSLAASAPARQPASAPLESLHDLSSSHGGQDQPGPLVLLRVRALVPAKVTLSDPAQGTVRATVLAIDAARNQIKVQTAEGQQLTLFLPSETLARLHVGAPCLLQVTNRSTRDASRPPEHDAAFW